MQQGFLMLECAVFADGIYPKSHQVAVLNTQLNRSRHLMKMLHTCGRASRALDIG